MRRFEQQKKFALERLNKALEKNQVDSEIIPLVHFINSLENFYTTSTCAGRISILQDLGSKKDNIFIGKWHHEVKFAEIKKAIKELPERGIIWFKHEPSILHIVAKDLEKAKFFLLLGLSSGFKRSGIQGTKDERYITEICSTERIDAPIAENGILFVDENYLNYLTKLANKKFRKEKEKLKKFEEKLRGRIFKI